MAHVTGHHKKAPPKRGRPRRITIEDADNGFLVRHHREDEHGNVGPPEGTSVFTKHAPMHKHVKALAAEMRPAADASTEEMQGYEPESQQS